MPEPTPTPPEAKEQLTEGQQVLVNAFRGQLDTLQESLASAGTDPDQAKVILQETRDKANSLLREQGINAELT